MSKSTKRKSIEQYNKVIELKNNGMKISEIVKETGLGRSCISNWINRGRKTKEDAIETKDPIEFLKKISKSNNELNLYSNYSYLLGLYLGDGCLHIGRTTLLYIALDKKYEKLNKSVIDTMTVVFNKTPTIYDRSIDRGQNFIANSLNIKHSKKGIEILFPQHGKGKKHLRKIELTDWQKKILISNEFVKGLFFSDGSYYYCKARKQYEYNFVNCSLDIIKLLEDHLNILGIKYNIHKKNKLDDKATAIKYHINIVVPKEVEKLHNLIGDKNNPR